MVELPPRADGKLDVGGAVGRDGTLSVVKDLGMKKSRMWAGAAGERRERSRRILRHTTLSANRRPQCVRAGGAGGQDLSILTAGGYLLQLLPGASDAEITHLEQNVAALPSVTELLRSGALWNRLWSRLWRASPRMCWTSSRCGINAIAAPGRVWNAHCFRLGGMSLRKWRRRASLLRVSCHFCDKKYYVDAGTLLDKTKG